MEKLYHEGVMRTCEDNCQFVCITQSDYYKILHEEQTNQRREKDDSGNTVLVAEPNKDGKVGHKVRTEISLVSRDTEDSLKYAIDQRFESIEISVRAVTYGIRNDEVTVAATRTTKS